MNAIQAFSSLRRSLRYGLLFSLGAMSAAAGLTASAQTMLLAGGFGGGGGETGNAEYRVSGVIGESFSGLSIGPRISHGSGFWLAAAGSLVGVSNEAEPVPGDEIPARYQLDQNYPNPFNPTTTIRFGLPEDAHVEIGVYNVLGRQIRRLVDRQMTAGWHSVSWDSRNADGSPAASGLYLYQMKTEKHTATRRMMLVK